MVLCSGDSVRAHFVYPGFASDSRGHVFPVFLEDLYPFKYCCGDVCAEDQDGDDVLEGRSCSFVMLVLLDPGGDVTDCSIVYGA